MTLLISKARKTILAALIAVFLLCTASSSAFAATPHEDPEAAKPVYSGISLLRYYSDSLDFVLSKNYEEVKTRLDMMPFANIPENLIPPTNNFAESAINVSALIKIIDKDIRDLRLLVEQGSFDKAAEVSAGFSINFEQAYTEVKNVDSAVQATGSGLKVQSAPSVSELRKSYDAVLEKIRRIKDLLDLYRNIVSGLTSSPFTYADLIFQVTPDVAFVGDEISFQGVLTSEETPVGGRNISILVNGSPYITARTEADGHFKGMLTVPYWYVPEMELQAIYYPRNKGNEVSFPSLSQIVKLKVLFYDATLEIRLEKEAYPGLETAVAGSFVYGENPPPSQRSIEIYIDDAFVSEDAVEAAFTNKIRLPPELEVGEHTITVIAAAVKRYSPVTTTAVLPVTKAIPILNMKVPMMAMIPGSIALEGSLSSELSPVNSATVKILLGKSKVETASLEDGTFSTKLKLGMGFSFVGSQDMQIKVIPREPWLAPLVAKKKVVIVNLINCLGLLAVIILLGVYVPGRLRKKFALYSKQDTSVGIPVTPTGGLTPAYSNQVTSITDNGKVLEHSEEPRDRIFYWYRLTLALVQKITSTSIKPHQTLREFAEETGRVLRPLAKYFFEFTRMIERLLYSSYMPTETDIATSGRLSHQIGAVTEPDIGVPIPQNIRIMGGETLTGYSGVPLSREASEAASSNQSLTTRRQLSWLWALLFIAIVYYVLLLLLIVTLIISSPGYASLIKGAGELDKPSVVFYKVDPLYPQNSDILSDSTLIGGRAARNATSSLGAMDVEESHMVIPQMSATSGIVEHRTKYEVI